MKHTIYAFVFIFHVVVAAGLLDHANLLYNQGDIQEAIALYKKAALEGENPSLCYFNLANAFFQIDSIPQSIVYYRASISHAPEFFRGYLNLAIAYYTLEDIGSCIAVVKRALELNPNDEKALFILAASYRKAGAYPEAITAFERLVAINPEKEDPYIALAEMYRELLDPDEAIEWLSRYPESGDNISYVHILISDIYESRKDLQKALYYLKLSFEKDMGNKWVYYRIVQLHLETGNDLVALEAAKRGLELFPEFAELALLAGNIAFQHEKLYEAERFYTIAHTHGSAGAVVGLENIRLMRQQNASMETNG